MKPVAVLGAGPAGLIAAHQVGLLGKPVAVLSAPGSGGVPEPSRLGGAQFLHKPVPMITDDEPDAVITYRTEGTSEGYYEKVYWSDPTVPFVSMSKIKDGQQQSAWHLQAAYERLWSMLEPAIQPMEVTAEYIAEALEKEWFEYIISSVPLPSICLQPEVHTFVSTKHQIANECILSSLPENTVMYDGTKDHSWHRCSNLFGHGGTEWHDRPDRLPLPTVTAHKPLKTNCRCHSASVIRVGRFGTWRKGVLVSDSMDIVLKALG